MIVYVLVMGEYEVDDLAVFDTLEKAQAAGGGEWTTTDGVSWHNDRRHSAGGYITREDVK